MAFERAPVAAGRSTPRRAPACAVGDPCSPWASTGGRPAPVQSMLGVDRPECAPHWVRTNAPRSKRDGGERADCPGVESQLASVLAPGAGQRLRRGHGGAGAQRPAAGRSGGLRARVQERRSVLPRLVRVGEGGCQLRSRPLGRSGRSPTGAPAGLAVRPAGAVVDPLGTDLVVDRVRQRAPRRQPRAGLVDDGRHEDRSGGSSPSRAGHGAQRVRGLRGRGPGRFRRRCHGQSLRSPVALLPRHRVRRPRVAVVVGVRPRDAGARAVGGGAPRIRGVRRGRASRRRRARALGPGGLPLGQLEAPCPLQLQSGRSTTASHGDFCRSFGRHGGCPWRPSAWWPPCTLPPGASSSSGPGPSATVGAARP